MYRDLVLAVLADENAAAARTVDRVRARHPDLSRDALVHRLTEQTAWRCAAVGGTACAAMELMGRVISAADVSYQLAALNRLAASIARARGRQTTMMERAAAAGGSLLTAVAAEAARRGASAASRRLLGRRTPGAVVWLSALAGAGAGYAGAKLFARAFDRFLDRAGSRPVWWR